METLQAPASPRGNDDGAAVHGTVRRCDAEQQGEHAGPASCAVAGTRLSISRDRQCARVAQVALEDAAGVMLADGSRSRPNWPRSSSRASLLSPGPP